MSDTSDRLTRALSLLESLEPGAPERVQGNLVAFHQDTAEPVLGYAFADVVGRDGIDLKTREMLTVAMLAAMGTAQGQLEFHMRAAMNTGIKPRGNRRDRPAGLCLRRCARLHERDHSCQESI